jgi:hypothetical protein
MNAILNKVIDTRNGHYCHAIEVSTVYELKVVIETLYSEFENEFTVEEIKEFFSSMSIIAFDSHDDSDQNNYEFEEDEINDFNTDNFIDELTY